MLRYHLSTISSSLQSPADHVATLDDLVLMADSNGLMQVGTPGKIAGWLNSRHDPTNVLQITKFWIDKNKQLFMVEGVHNPGKPPGQRLCSINLTLLKEKTSKALLQQQQANLVSATPRLSNLDSNKLNIEIFEQSGKVIVQSLDLKNTFKIFDLAKLKTWKYEDDHKLDKVKFVDSKDFTLMVGVNTTSKVAGKNEYKIVLYDDTWKSRSTKKLCYSDRFALEWITISQQIVWLIFANKELIVFDMSLKSSSDVLVQKFIEEIPLRVEIDHITGKVILAYADWLGVYSSTYKLLAKVEVDPQYESYDFTVIEDRPAILVLMKQMIVQEGKTTPSCVAFKLFKIDLMTDFCTLAEVELFPNPLLIGSQDLHLPHCRGGFFLTDEKGKVFRMNSNSPFKNNE